MLKARRDDVPGPASGKRAAPQVVGAHGREAVGFQPRHVLLVGHGVFGAPVGVVVGAELIGQVVSAVILANDADVVSGVAQLLGVGPRALGNRHLVGDVPLRVGEHLVLAGALAREQRGARGGADGGWGEAAGESKARLAHRVDDGSARVRISQATDRVGAVLIGHDDQNVSDVVGNVPCLIGHWNALLSVKSGGISGSYWETTLSMSSSSAPLVSVRNFAVKATARIPKAQ